MRPPGYVIETLDDRRRRFEACFAACRGIPTEALEAGVIADLLAVCEAFLALYRDSDMRPEDECHGIYCLAEDAVDKAKGETQ